jgi:AraC family transcriptional regulator, transcriptional activator of pobA
MEKIESIESFYKAKLDWIPENFKNEIGHFNVFNLKPFIGEKAQSALYKRHDFYKIMLVKGNSKVHYADKVIEVKKQVLSFSNPQIPYKWEHLNNINGGYFCIFNQHFFHQYGNLNQYSVFQPNGTPIFELSDEQVEKVADIYKRMFEEINSEYVYKYDVLRNLVFELLHFAMKMDPSSTIQNQQLNASQRIATLFLELLERQFPIDGINRKIHFRTASDFAKQLNVHVNHLNKAVKETTQKTTSQIIAERVLQESKILLKHSTWNVSEIAFALGFSEVTNFNNFFKKHLQMSPLKFRNI